MQYLPAEILSYLFDNNYHILKSRLISKDINKLIIKGVVPLLSLKTTTKIQNFQLKPLKNIKYINLEQCKLISNKGLKYLQNAQIINLRGVHKITDKGLIYLKSITKINLTGCLNITNDYIKYLPNLDYINITFSNINYNNNFTTINNINEIIYDEILKNNYYIADDKPIPYKSNSHFNNKINLNEEPDINANLITTNFLNNKIIFKDSQFNSIINYRIKLFNKIYSGKNYIRDYKDICNNPIFLPENKAKERLFKNKYTKNFCQNIKDFKLDSLIGGSTGLSCVYKQANFKPNDIDLYIKNITTKKILLVEDAIYKTFDILNLIVVRCSITVTFHIQTLDKNIFLIQINLFNIRNWNELFIGYHTDLTCIGYEILNDKFVYMNKRFSNILTNKVHYFCNILNFDKGSSLWLAAGKYIKRGFNCEIIEIGTKNINIVELLINKLYKVQCYISSEPNDTRIVKTYLPHIIASKYKNKGILSAISSSAYHLFDKYEISVPIYYLSILMVYNDKENDLILKKDIKLVREFLSRPEIITNKYLDNYKKGKINNFIGLFDSKNKKYVGIHEYLYIMRSWNIFNDYSIIDDFIIV
jgi:hypothetical protein